MTGFATSRRRLLAGLAGLVASALPRTALASQSSYYRGPVSDHFDGVRFFNPGSPNEDQGLIDVLKWRMGSDATDWPDELPRMAPDKPPARVNNGDCRVSFVGHASFLVQIDGVNILLDPVWSQRASPFSFAGPKRHAPPGVAFDDLPRIDAVLISHNHYDHMDLVTVGKLWKRDKPRIIAPLGNDAVIRQADRSIVVESGDWGDSFRLNPRVVVTLRRAQHWSARGLSDRRQALWAAFVIDAPGGGVYFVGDSGFGDGSSFRDIGHAHPQLRLALLPIGAYAPRWFMKEQHMNPDEAVEAFRLCGAQRAIAHHWGTFQLSDEGYDEPRQKLTEALTRTAMSPQRFSTLLPGESLQLTTSK
ncbi:MBL fold metallo-hydrolase [Tardiphaga sp.]|uniref:MBL fold metallo-hydrolase n=1 Tax=Tardiphaga sp. TaxID=1926292 RepID=UPI0037DA3791